MDRLADILSLHDVTVNDILYEDTQVSDEKFERFDDYLFVITDILNKAPDSDRWRTENCHCGARRRSFEGGLGVDMAVLIALMVGTTCGLLLEARRREMFKAPRPAKSFS